MKRQVLSSFAKIAGLSALLGSAMLMADSGPRASAEIPFAFTVQNQVLPAGTYWVEDLRTMLKINDAQNHKTVVVLVQSGEARRNSQPGITFKRYGDSYFLSEVVSGYGTRSLVVGKSRAERKLTASKNAPAPVLASIRMK